MEDRIEKESKREKIKKLVSPLFLPEKGKFSFAGEQPAEDSPR